MIDLALPQRMRAAVYNGPHDISLKEVETPRVGAADILIQVTTCGICGSIATRPGSMSSVAR